MKISAETIRKQGKKMSPEELQQHMKNVQLGVGAQKNKKKYSRKQKHKEHRGHKGHKGQGY